MKKYLILFFAILTFTFVSCDTETSTDSGGTPVEKIAGDWWITTQDGSPALIHIYNTAANDGTEVWFDDTFWSTKEKVPCDVKTLTFGSDDALQNTSLNKDESLYNITVTIKNGKILEGAAKTPSGVAADSIYCEVEYSDDPGTIYHFGGFRRTGFDDDELK